MALLTPVKKLFIPNKNMPAFNPYRYGTDMRAIENYVNNLPAPTPGGAYASLTGPGETATPGDLVQAGGFTVNDTAPDGIFFFSFGGIGGQVQIAAADGSFTNFASSVVTDQLIIQEVSGPPGLTQTQMGDSGWSLGVGGSANNAINVELNGSGGANVGFFGAAGVARAATPVTLGDVITILQNLGLCT